jgi:S1-C subfamily serine protease
MIARRLAAAALLLALALPALAQTGDKAKAQAEAEETASAVVRVRSKSVPNARSAATLGERREGSGVLVREGYVATIGYLVIEAEAIEVTGADGRTVPAALAGYDHASGFGVLKLLAPLAGKPLPLGISAALTERQPALVARHAGGDGLDFAIVQVVSRRAFSGSWEYLLESAIYTYPPVLHWSGASLISAKGELLGLGSLIVADVLGDGADATAGSAAPGNLFVPVDLLKPILGELIERGRAPGPARPWLGMNTEQSRGRLFVTRVSPEGPADRAGVKAGDVVIAIGGEEVGSLADFYRKLWARGAAGVEVPLRLLQGLDARELSLRSIDRTEYFRQARSY